MVNDSPFGTLGFWMNRGLPADERLRLAQATEKLGYGTLWISGGRDTGAFGVIREALEATGAITVGSSVINMWLETAATSTVEFQAFEREFPGRFYLGMGPSHATLIDQLHPGEYQNPYAKTVSYLDELDAQPEPVPNGRRLTGALGPQALRLAARRALGSLPYNVPPAHTRFAREALGPDALLAPELAVVLDTDHDRAMARAREFISTYLGMANYTRPLLGHGFTEADLADGGSDRLIEGIFGIGSLERIGEQVDAHLAAGADHVALQVLPVDGQERLDVLTAIAESRGL